MVGVILTGCAGITANEKRSGQVGLGSALGGAASYGIADATGADSRDAALWGLGGAAVGAVATNMVLGPDDAVFEEGMKQGYQTGQIDAIKRQYWMQQSMAGWMGTADGETPRVEEEAVETVYYEMPGQTTASDGTKLDDHRVFIPVVRGTGR